MNTATQAETQALATVPYMPRKQPSDAAPKRAYTAFEHAQEMAEEEFCTAERLGGWLESANNERESSAYWTAISTAELVSILFGIKASPEQALAARDTIRRRFLAEHSEEIAARSYELCGGVA